MANLFFLSGMSYTDTGGIPYASAKLYTYETGTTTDKATYSNAALSAANANPVVAGADGVFGDIYMIGGRYKMVLKTSADVTLQTWDPVDADRQRIKAASAPSPTYPGLEWHDTSTNILYERNSGDTAWLSRGNIDSQNALIQKVNAQTGTTYTIDTEDRGKLVTLSNGSAVAVTLPEANSSTFADGWYVDVKNKGAGAVTITPTTSTVGGGTALVLEIGDEARINSDATNYQTTGGGRITGAQVSTRQGYIGLPQVDGNSALAIALAHMGRSILHDEVTARTYTIPANSSVPFPVGAAFEIVNNTSGGTITLAITTDTLRRGDGVAGTGSRSILADSIVVVRKTKSTEWMISGIFT